MGSRRRTKTGKKGEDPFGKRHRRFGEVARRLGLIDDADIRQALREQASANPRRKIGEILVARGKLTPADVECVLAHQLGMRRRRQRG